MTLRAAINYKTRRDRSYFDLCSAGNEDGIKDATRLLETRDVPLGGTNVTPD